MAAIEGHEQVTLRILVDKKKIRVIFAEAEKVFVDVVFKLLTFPSGAIARFVSNDSIEPPVRVGSLNTMSLRVEDMDSIEDMTVNASVKEVLDLLKCSLLATTTLTAVFLLKKHFLDVTNCSLEICPILRFVRKQPTLLGR
ncbi:DUF674 family protein [Quillaja saponaria]|uniref:DUF674 family protein n=1 Tax=Quillaja saponaria TaxID=32244 RepID=A0AAD7PC52_QUISA|nr:DUF674 family protein [Quillaja saponaria]